MLAKRLHRANPKSGEGRSLREISKALAAAGYVMTERYRNKGKGSTHQHREKGDGRPFNPATIKAMVEGPMPSPPSGPRNVLPSPS